MIERVVVEYIANALWQIPLLAGGAWLLLRMARPGVRVQHGVWLGVLALAVLLPLRGLDFGDDFLQTQREVAAPQLRVVGAFYEPPAQSGWLPVAREWVTVSPRLHRVHLPAEVVDWVIGVYAASVMFGVFRIVRAWRVARRLVDGSRETALTCYGSVRFFVSYARRFGCRLPLLRESDEVSSPMIVGAVRPVLLLPEGFGRHTEDEVKAVLSHELAHVRRWDYLVNLMCQVVALPVVWHPVMHGVQQRIRRTREMVCDAMAAEEMRSEIGYARCLLAMARGMTDERGLVEQAGLGLFGDNVLEERVMRLMETKSAMSVRAKAARAVSGASAMVAAAAMAAMFHVVPTMAASHVASAAVMPMAMQSVQDAQQLQEPQQLVASGMSEPEAAAVQEKAQEEKKPAAAVEKKEKTYVWRDKEGDGKPYAIVDGQRRELTAEEKARIDKEVADAKTQVAEAMEKINGPEFKRQMEDMSKQIAESSARLNSAEFKKQMEDARAQAAEAKERFNSPEFKQQIEEAQKQAAKAREWVNSPEFKKQLEEQKKVFADMAEVQKARAEAMKDVTAKLNSPEYRHEMEDMQKRVSESTAKLNSPEFKQQMENLQKEMQEMQKDRMDEVMRQFEGRADAPGK